MDGITNQNQMKNTHLFHIVFEVLKELLIIICTMQPLDLLFFLFFNVRFHISRYQFSPIFRASYNTIYLFEKKIFVRNFSFLMDSLKPLHPL